MLVIVRWIHEDARLGMSAGSKALYQHDATSTSFNMPRSKLVTFRISSGELDVLTQVYQRRSLACQYQDFLGELYVYCLPARTNHDSEAMLIYHTQC